MCGNSLNNYVYGSTETKRVTVTEREYDSEGNLTREVETVTVVTTTPQYYTYPYTATWGGSLDGLQQT